MLNKKEVLNALERGNDAKSLLIKSDSLLEGLNFLSKFKSGSLTHGGSTTTFEEEGHLRCFTIIYGPTLSELSKTNMSSEDFVLLGRLNWYLDEETDCISCVI